MKRIIIAVITEADVCSASFCSSLAASIKFGLTNDIEFLPVFIGVNDNWSMAFNQALTLAWRQGVDGFVCISPRVSWKLEYLIELVQSKHDAVAMPVATKNGFEVKLGEISRLQEDEESGEIKVLGASLDFIYLSSYTVNQLCSTHPLVAYRGAEMKLVLQSGDIYKTYFDPSEILAYRLRELGIEIWLRAKSTATRADIAEYQNDFDELLQQLKVNG